MRHQLPSTKQNAPLPTDSSGFLGWGSNAAGCAVSDGGSASKKGPYSSGLRLRGVPSSGAVADSVGSAAVASAPSVSVAGAVANAAASVRVEADEKGIGALPNGGGSRSLRPRRVSAKPSAPARPGRAPAVRPVQP